LSAEDAARDIGLARFASWADTERIAVNVETLHREFNGDHSPRDTLALFARMGHLYYDRRSPFAHDRQFDQV
jgi:cyclase